MFYIYVSNSAVSHHYILLYFYIFDELSKRRLIPKKKHKSKNCICLMQLSTQLKDKMIFFLTYKYFNHVHSSANTTTQTRE